MSVPARPDPGHVVVTGVAGFIGSFLAEALLERGHEVVGIDAFTPYYPSREKRANLVGLRRRPEFWLVEDDLTRMELDAWLDGASVVFHQAAQPGVRSSWGADFPTYVTNNVLATQRLLEACKGRPLGKLIYASSSSVYGDAESYPTAETLRPQPVSPYGVTKLAAEHLCEVYRKSFDVPTASLRLFTVYGPRQRPDMAFSRLVGAALAGEAFELYGDGEQTRDFTFVGDVVQAMADVARSPWSGVANIGGGSRTSLNGVLAIVRELCGEIRLTRRSRATGDVRHTAADISVAKAAFGYRPRTSLAQGLAAMVAWERSPRKVMT
jgi:nucleoside-diphosphate-sugar epimerase